VERKRPQRLEALHQTVPAAQVLDLTRDYRSNPQILAWANRHPGKHVSLLTKVFITGTEDAPGAEAGRVIAQELVSHVKAAIDGDD
jgi:hypothetical protein